MNRPMLPNPYVVADQLVDLRHCLELRLTDKATYKATQQVIDWLESLTLDSRMHGGPKAGQSGKVMKPIHETEGRCSCGYKAGHPGLCQGLF